MGTIAPGNGFGAGPAFVTHYTPNENWRLSFNADAIVSTNGSWRAGVYGKAVYTHIKLGATEIKPFPILNFYAQGASLNKVAYYGLGPDTKRADQTFFGMRETIVGANVIYPVFKPLNMSLHGEMNGRFVDIRPSNGNGSPSIETLYTDATAPGLATQPGFLQLGEAARIRPIVWDDRLHFNYQASFQEFVAPNSRFSFNRFNLDLSQEFALYSSTTRIPIPRDANGPDECSIDRLQEFAGCALDKKQQVQNCEEKQGKDSSECKSISRDYQGSIGLRFFLSTSLVPSGNVVPFYFQPTLGGSDINGNPSLASYQDYRFRAPDVMFLRQSFEHSLGSLPLGVVLIADEGKVALNGGDLGSTPWLHSFSAGLTLRAGGFPQVFLLFSWGGKEGTHTIANVNTSLLGGSARPSLY